MKKDKIIGQTIDVGFQVGVRKTLAISTETAWDFLFSEQGISTWLGKIDYDNFALNRQFKTKDEIEGKINTFIPYSHIRLTWKPKNWTNTSALQIRLINRKGKTTISFHQDKLLDIKQRDEMKTHWKKVIEKIWSELTT